MSIPALTGLRVLDLSRLLPGPFCTLVLADLGAEVIKIEEPGLGDYVRYSPPMATASMSAFFVALNRGKKSIALDLKSPKGQELLLQLISTADVMVESFRPGVLARLGLDEAALKKAKPDLILCSLSGFGQTGSMKDRAGHDLTYMALGGGLSLAPNLPGFQAADIGGALNGAMSILAGIIARDRHGVGFQHLDVSLCEAATLFNVLGFAQALVEKSAPAVASTSLTGGLACYDLYTTKDNLLVAATPLEPKFFQSFLAAAGLPTSLLALQYNEKRQDEVRAALKTWWADHSFGEAMKKLEPADVCVEPVLDLMAVIQHPMHQERGVFPPGTPDLPIVHRVLPLGLETVGLAAAPGLGEHNNLLCQFGLSAEEAKELGKKPGKTAGRML